MEGRLGRPTRTLREETSGLLSNPLWVALLLLTVVTISKVHQYFGIIGKGRPALLLFAMGAAFALLRPRLIATQNLLRTWPGRVIIGLGVFACVSAPFGLSLGGSANFILQSYSKTLLYAAMVMVAIRGWQDVRRLVWAYVTGAAILAFLSTFVVGISKTTSGASYDANDVGLILVVSLPLTLVAFQASAMRGKILSGLILVLVAVTIAKTQSRGAFLGLLLVGVGILLSLRSVSAARRIAILGVATAALAIAAPKGYWDLMNTLRDPKSDYNWDSVNGRREVAKRGLGYMLQYPVFGIGINNFARAEGTISDKARERAIGTGIRWIAPHNSFIQVGAELGIPGLILWSSLVFGGMVGVYRMHRRLPTAWRRGNQEQRFLYALTAGLPIALLGFAITSFFVSFAYLDPIYILSAMVAGTYLLVSKYTPLPATLAARGRSPRTAGVPNRAVARGQVAGPSQLG